MNILIILIILLLVLFTSLPTNPSFTLFNFIKNAIIKTANGIRGTLKNINSKNSHGNIRATFEKKIPKGTSVSIVSYLNVEAYKNYEEIFGKF